MTINSVIFARYIAFIVAVFTCFSSGHVFAGCSWTGIDGHGAGNDRMGPLTFYIAGTAILSNKWWYEDSRYPVGSYMGTYTTAASTAAGCDGLNELIGQKVNTVYIQPPGATPHGAGYRIPTNVPGVSIDIEFPNSLGRYGDGIWVTASQNLVFGGGVITGTGRFSPFAVRLSVVKTGTFTVTERDERGSSIRVDGGLGWFRYYSASNPAIQAASQTPLLLPTTYQTGGSDADGKFVGVAAAPICEINALGNVGLGAGYPTTTIAMPAVKTTDFSGAGAIDAGAKSQQFMFTCHGTPDTKPIVSFEATYPLSQGLEGVGMPSSGSDVGIQVLLNNQPVRFGTYSPVLGWDLMGYTGTDIKYGFSGIRGDVAAAQGRYCRENCGTNMTGANWAFGGAGSGDNKSRLDAMITFKYYQTTNTTPQPKTFTVPFTVMLDVQ